MWNAGRRSARTQAARILAVAATATIGLLGASTALAADDAGAKDLASRIASVTVFSDRAQVTRRAPVALDEAPAVWAFRRLPGWVDDGSVRVAVTPPDVGRIVDVRVARDHLARATDPELRQAEAAVEEITVEVAALDDEMAVLEAQAKQIEAIKAFSAEKISKDTATRDVSVASFRQVLGFIGDSLRETAKARRDVARKRAALAPELAARQRKLAELRGLTQLEETAVFVTLMGTRRGDASVELTYMLPGATWEPAHELRTLGAAEDRAEVLSFATVTQTSGEDWEDVEIAFATQSSQESIRIPELEALTLGDVPRVTRVIEARAASFSRAQAAFAGQSRAWNEFVQKGNAGVRFEELYDDNVKVFQTAK